MLALSWGKIALAVAGLGILTLAVGEEPVFGTISANFHVATVLNSSGTVQELKAWSVDELAKFKQTRTAELDPATGKIVQWKGVLLSSVIEKSLNGLPAEKKAQVDLVILKNEAGQKAIIPRAFIVKYPMMLALVPGSGTRQGPVYSVVPWTSRSKSKQEGLPLESYFVSGVKKIELTNYRDLYGHLFLKRRTDPAAMRGEKIFVQNCEVCSAGEIKPVEAGPLVGHPAIKGAPPLSARDRRAVLSYLEAYRAENASQVQRTSASGK